MRYDLAVQREQIDAQLGKLLTAIKKFCEPYLAIERAAKHARRAISLAYPSIMHEYTLASLPVRGRPRIQQTPDPIGLVPVGVKRKYEHCDSLGAMGPPVRKLAYQPPRPLGTSRWPIRPARVSRMPMSGFTPGGCAAESDVRNVGLPSTFTVRVCVLSVQY